MAAVATVYCTVRLCQALCEILYMRSLILPSQGPSETCCVVSPVL